MKFDALGLKDELVAGVAALGFEETTPVQSAVIPLLMESDRDLVALAQTGTGKTAAFGLPILQQIDPENRQVQALILAPTRELCMQITRDLQSFARDIEPIKVLAIYGGTEIRGQLSTLERGIQIVVATPGRLVDILNRGVGDFSAVQQVVLDEADEMMSMGFEEDLNDILDAMPGAAQRLLFSATMPRAVAGMAKRYLDDPLEITLGDKNAPADRVSHQLVVVHSKNRYDALRRLVDDNPGIYGIVFCRTRTETQMVADRLTKDGYAAEALNGDMLQEERDLVMKKFRDRRLQLLVATDVAARGLDIDDISHVLHYNIPDDYKTYTHRSGRTGRAGKSGKSIAIIHNREQFKIDRFEQAMDQKIEVLAIPTGESISQTNLLDLAERLKNQPVEPALLEKNLAEMDVILADLSKEELIQRLAMMQCGALLKYYRDTPDLSTEPEKQKTKPNPENRVSGKEAREAHVPRKMTEGMIELVINLGKRNGLTKGQIQEFLKQATHGIPVNLGRVNIVEMQSYFEVPYVESADIIDYFAKKTVEFEGRRVNIALAGNAKVAEKKDNRRARKAQNHKGNRKRYR